MGQNRSHTLRFVQFAGWRHRGRSCWLVLSFSGQHMSRHLPNGAPALCGKTFVTSTLEHPRQ